MAAPEIGILGQAEPAAATNTDLYTVTSGRRAVASTLVIQEMSDLPGGKVQVWVRKNGAALATGNCVFRQSIDVSGRYGLTEGWGLGDGDIVSVESTNGGVTFTLFGEETDVPAI